jgi:hypothetical protein
MVLMLLLTINTALVTIVTSCASVEAVIRVGSIMNPNGTKWNSFDSEIQIR